MNFSEIEDPPGKIGTIMKMKISDKTNLLYQEGWEPRKISETQTTRRQSGSIPIHT